MPLRDDFDSCVYADEATSDHNHVHVSWSEHRVAPLDPRVMRAVHAVMDP